MPRAPSAPRSAVAKASSSQRPLRVAEFFAGIGLVRLALERAGFSVVFANDYSAAKRTLYAANFDASHFHLSDIRDLRGQTIPAIDLATASFPCTDLSLAGQRQGLRGTHSGMFWEFARVLEEMGPQRPRAVLIENVLGLANSHGGADLEAMLLRLGELGYRSDLFMADAAAFVPQSRPRLFVVAARDTVPRPTLLKPSTLRPRWVGDFAAQRPHLPLQWQALTLPDGPAPTLRSAVERLPPEDPRWWNTERTARFLSLLKPLQQQRLELLRQGKHKTWATAYRRTRQDRAVWEIRADAISGCLRTGTGGSSRQAVVEAGRGEVRVRAMTAREYARLQGADDFKIDAVCESAAIYGFGDAVCVPVVQWIAESYLLPLLNRSKRTSRRASA